MINYIKQNQKPEDQFEAEAILKYMNRMMANNKNFLAVVTGSTGSGKSYSCLRLAELWYKYYFKKKEFPTENIVFTVEALVKRLNSGELKKGDLLIAEEIGIGANSKNFQSKTNKALQFILQSFRSLNIIVLFNVPHFSFFDKTARMLMHCHMQTVKINKKEKYCLLKPYFLSISQSTGKIYTKWLKVSKGGVVKLRRLKLYKPTEDLIIHYEEGKENFVRTLISDMEDKIKKDEGNNRKLKPLTPRQALVYEYLMQGKRIKEIVELTGLSQPNVSKAKISIEKKGYEWRTSEKLAEIKRLEEIRQNL
jgi:DNA-binding CsgD family transcriptional regulator